MRICLLPASLVLFLVSLWVPHACLGQNIPASGFTRLEQIVSPKIIAGAEAYPGGQYEPGNLVDGAPGTEYASNGKGTNTFLEFDFGHPVRIVAFQHID